MGNKSNAIHSECKTNDSFIINFKKNCTVNDPSHFPETSCPKRVVFISLIGLFQSYKKCPAHLLYSSVLFMPLKKEWIYSPSKYVQQLRSASSGLIHHDTESQQLFELIKWKHSQGLVIWANEDESCGSDTELVHSFWREVSHKLVSLYDPITSQSYNPLILDSNDVSYKTNQTNTMRDIDVLTELYFKPLKYGCVKAILNASNPESFDVVTSYPSDGRMCRNQFVCMQLEDDSDAESDDEWWISSDYL